MQLLLPYVGNQIVFHTQKGGFKGFIYLILTLFYFCNLKMLYGMVGGLIWDSAGSELFYTVNVG